MNHHEIIEELKKLSNPEIAEHSQRFFKTGAGEYGESDVFLGIRVPNIRETAKKFNCLSLEETEKLLHSTYHEARFCALVILVYTFQKGNEEVQKNIYECYISNTKYINNWDLVDTSAHHIAGPFLYNRDRKLLYTFAKSKNLWERRIAIMSTLHFIRQDDFADTLSIARLLLKDPHDLIHKADGWMLREVGNRDHKAEEAFLEQHIQDMPRTMVRYAIEKFPEAKRKKYLLM